MSKLRAALFVLSLLLTLPVFSSGASAQALEFLDETGAASGEVLENGSAGLRVSSAADNTDPFTVNTVTVAVQSQFAGDSELVSLTETGPDTALFEGSIDLLYSPPQTGNGILETYTGPPPGYEQEVLTASYGPLNDTATVVGSRVAFLDEFGRLAASFPLGGTVRVRVTDHVRNSPQTRDDVYLNLQVGSGDQENLQLMETGFDTGVFEGEIPSHHYFGSSSYDGTLRGAVGAAIQATHYNASTPPTVAAATFTASSTVFLDAAGNLAGVFLEGTEAFVRVVDHIADVTGSEDVTFALVTTALSGDAESVTLTETGPETGVFEGSIDLRRGPGQPYTSLLDVGEDPGPPHRFDTLTASHSDSGSGSSATATTLNWRVTFRDEFGNPRTTFAVGSRAHVRVEEPSANYNPNQFDQVYVIARSASGDEEPLGCLETGRDTGVFGCSVPLDGDNPPAYADGSLQVQVGDEIDAARDVGFTEAPALATVEYVQVAFIDEEGRPTGEVLENGTARVRVFSQTDNSNPGTADSLSIPVQSRFAGDLESVTLTETGEDTDVFEGSVDLTFNPSQPGNGTLETSVGPPPAYEAEELTASYGPYEAGARIVGSRVVFLDGYGRVTQTFPLGSPVRVRVTDHVRNSPQTQDNLYIQLTSPQTGVAGDQENLQLWETGFDTGVFEGQLPSSQNAGSSSYDGVLRGAPGGTVEATHYNANSPYPTVAAATFAGSATLFVDASGNPASVFLEGSKVYVRVIDHLANQSSSPDFTGVVLTAEISGDTENLTLIETGGDTGLFEGSIDLRREFAQFYNGVLESSEDLYPPHQFDTLRATHMEPFGGTSSATATTLNWRITFRDAFGNLADSYAVGSRAYVRVEQPGANQPGQFDRVYVRLTSAQGDEEYLELLETGKNTGWFEGSVALDGNGPAISNNGSLQVQVGGEIQAVRDVGFTETPARATIDYIGLEFIDEEGRPTGEVLENGTARVRVFSQGDNPNPGLANYVTIPVRSRFAGDQESITLTETGEDTSVFEGSIDLKFSPAQPSNGTLETSVGPYPAYEAEELTVSYGPYEAEARLVGSRVFFLDAFGRVTQTVPLGSPVRVRVVDHVRNEPQMRDNLYLNLFTSDTNDAENVQLEETGFDTGVFEGQIPSSPNGGSSLYDGVLRGSLAATITAFHYNYNSPYPTEARATFSGSSTLFVDAAGNPVSVYLEGSRVYVRVIDHLANVTSGADFTGVTLTAELSGDSESLTLVETGGNTGVFQGSIDLRRQPAQPNNGFLESSEAAGPPHEFDTLTASHIDAAGTSTATAATLNWRIAFIDAFGTPADSFAVGSRAYVRVEQPGANNPGMFDRVYVRVTSAPGDEEYLELLETGKNTGRFEGSVALDGMNSVISNDGSLQVQVGGSIEAVRDVGYTEAPARAVIDYIGLEFIDEAGRPTGEALENGAARLRVFSQSNNFNPGTADTLTLSVRSRFAGDLESVTLTETGMNTSVFEGSIGLRFNPAQPGNGTLETSVGPYPAYEAEELTASYGPYEAEARIVGSRVVFLDAFGRETETYAIGAPVRVRVVDHTRNTPQMRDQIYVQVQSPETGDGENIQAQETGFDTGVFEGQIGTTQGFASSDNVLAGTVGGRIVATHYNFNSPQPTEATATFSGSSVAFLDANGNPAEVYLEGSRVYVRVVDFVSPSTSSQDFSSVTLTAALTGDSETLTLVETSLYTNVFEGSIELRRGSAQTQNGFLESSEENGPPHEFDTLTVSHTALSAVSTATATTLNWRVTFIDAFGNPAATYAVGSRAYVRVEQPSANNPGSFDRVYVKLRSASGDEEYIELLETGKNSGLFEGSIALSGTPGVMANDGTLQAQIGDEIDAARDFGYTEDPALAVIEYVGLEFIDEEGRPTVEVLENGTARLRLFSQGDNINPEMVDITAIPVRSRFAGDLETVTLTETGTNTRVFEGSVLLRFNPAQPHNETLETSVGSGPAYEAEELTASYGPYEAAARIIGSRVFFVDAFGRVTENLPLGQPVRVRVVDHARNEPLMRDDLYVSLSAASSFDSENVQLFETGFDTGVFEGQIPSTNGVSSPGDGLLLGSPGQLVQASHYNVNLPDPTVAAARFTASSTAFVDAAGNLASAYLEGSRVYVRVVDNQANNGPGVDFTGVMVTTALAGDAENLTLTETGGNTGVFEGSIELRRQPAQPNNGFLESSEEFGPPHEFDTLTATHDDVYGGVSTATATTLNWRITFTDAFGNEVSTYPQGSRAYVRVEQPGADISGQIDQVYVRVTSAQGDLEYLQLDETGVSTGLFTGSIALDGNVSPISGDGVLKGQVGQEIQAERDFGFTEAPARATIEYIGIGFIDAAGRPTGEVLESGDARVRVFSVSNNIDPGMVDTLGVSVTSVYSGDQETVVLTETGPSTSVFEGAFELFYNFAQPGDNILQTLTGPPPAHLPDEVRASYGPYTASAITVGSRVAFVDLGGQPVTTYSLRSRIRVRVEDQNRNQPGMVDTFYVNLQTPSDSENFLVTEDGPDSGLFFGFVTSAETPSGPDDGLLSGAAGQTVEAVHYNAHGPEPTVARATFTANLAPSTLPDLGETEEDTPVVIAVLANDTDADGGTLSVTSVTQGTNGSVAINPDGTVTYTPNAGTLGTDNFTYVMSDGQGGEATAPVAVIVSAGNEAPTPQYDNATTPEDQAVTINVLANDTDPDDDPLQVVSVTQPPGGGTVVLNPDSTVTYTPVPDFFGDGIVFTYIVRDPGGLEGSSAVTVVVTPVNDPPVAVDDAASTTEDQPVTVNLTANDSDFDSATWYAASVTQPANGAAVLNPDGTALYTPAAEFSGTDSFTYTLQDYEGGTDTATVTITVSVVNDAPVAVDDTATVDEDNSVTIAVLANDTDAEGNTLTVTSVSSGFHGLTVLNPDGTVTYTPLANTFGDDTFTYTISDGNSTDTGTVTVDVTPINDPPVAVDDLKTTNEDSISVAEVLANDSDPEFQTLTIVSLTQPANGTATLKPNGTIEYQGNLNYNGPDSYTYTIQDSAGATATATVSYTVLPINDAPVGNDDTATVLEDGSVIVNVLANDTDVDAGTLRVFSYAPGAHGTVTKNADETLTYTPAPGFSGTDSFPYQVEDAGNLRDGAIVTVTVTPVNDAPVAAADSATVAEDGSVTVSVLANDTDPENDNLTVTAVTQGANGSVTINAGSTVTYTPAANFSGTDAFTYTISDGNGGTATGTVSITVTPVNDAPAANADTATVAEDGSVTVSVLANDTDPENDNLTVIAVTQGANGLVTINAGSTVTYTPAANFSGSDTFTYTVSDGNGGTATASVTVTVTSTNDTPTANPDAATVAEDGSVTVSVLANDTDPENDNLTVTAVTQGANGSVTINAGSTVTYTPAANFSGSDTFTYTVSDGNGGTATGTVTITVTSTNDTPTANPDAATVAEDGSVTVSVLANDTDPENDNLTVIAVTQGAHGSVTINAGSTVTYTPAANFSGTDAFTYTVSDGNGGTAMAGVAITVTPVNDAPVAVDDTASTLAGSAVTISVLANDVDLDGPSLAIASVTQGTNGTVAISGNQVTYTAGLFVGSDSFTYTVSDGAGGSSTATVTVTVGAPPRVATGLQVRYDFDEGSGNTVTDVSGVGTPLNLTIQNTSAVTWLPGALSVNSSTLISSAGTATKVIAAAKASNALTLEAWVASDNLTQSGPARILTLSQNINKRNFTLGQSGSALEAQLRTTTTNANGISVLSPNGAASLDLRHVVFTRNAAGAAVLYVDGVQMTTQTVGGNLSSWDNGYSLALANELSGNRAWRGDLHLVAVYSQALTSTQVQQNFLAGPSGN
jgi:hypothetical protein